MSKQKVYWTVESGQLLDAASFNGMQVAIADDIQNSIHNAVEGIDEVALADNANRLGGHTLDQIAKKIIEEIQALPTRNAGYERIFTVLEPGQEQIIQHGLNSFPLVDIYQLEYFPAVCATDEGEEVRLVTFQIKLSQESKRESMRRRTSILEVEDLETYHTKLKLADLLTLYEVDYSDSTDIEELEASFWDSFLQRTTTDDFDPEQYGHSPAFQRLCKDQRTVGDLKAKGDFDRMILKMVPTKVSWYPPYELDGPKPRPRSTEGETWPHNHIKVVHYDFETLGIRLLGEPAYPLHVRAGQKQDNKVIFRGVRKEFLEELKIMVLLKA